MRFYRLATLEDMTKKETQLFATIPHDVIALCKQNGQAAAAIRWSNQSRITLNNANAQLREYAAFQQAFTDFLAGEPIYTDC